jgi:Cupin domain
MEDKVNLRQALAGFEGHWEPRIVAMLNDYKVLVVKVKDEFVWHSHVDTDDLFLVLKGRLTIQLRDREVELSEGELFVVPRGVEHCPTPIRCATGRRRSARSSPIRHGGWCTPTGAASTTTAAGSAAVTTVAAGSPAACASRGGSGRV